MKIYSNSKKILKISIYKSQYKKLILSLIICIIYNKNIFSFIKTENY